MIMSGVGGLLGIALGVTSSWIIRVYPDSPFAPRVEPSAIILAMGFAVGVGVFFGIYPAYRASQLDPIEALRYE
jgi:putative ABC transport system permease protein